MIGWRIAILVCMIVVFVVAVAALLWYLWMNCYRVKYLREPSPDVFHFYDFSNPRRLISLELTKWEGTPLPGNVAASITAMGGDASINQRSSTVPPLNMTSTTAAPGSSTVIVVNPDGSTTVGAAPRPAAAVPAAVGGAYDLHRKEHFILALAQRIGDTDPSTLAVSRLDPGNVLVELNLDDFLHPNKRDDHMRSTAVVPCVLTRHFSFNRDYYFDNPQQHQNPINQSAMQSRGNMSTFNTSRAGGGRRTANTSRHASIMPNHRSVSTPATPRDHYTSPVGQYPQQMLSNYSPNNDSGGGGMPLPVPLILPISPNISTNDPITLSSALYVFEHDGGVMGGGGGHGGGSSMAPFGGGGGGYGSSTMDEVPTAMAERLEQLIVHDKANGTFTVAPNAIAVVNVKQQSAVIKYTNGAPSRRVQRCVTGLPITYFYEGPDQSFPYSSTAPLYLPAGRWSLCATVTNEFGTDFRTQSRVFTVEIGR